jgi:hypothetical protein
MPDGRASELSNRHRTACLMKPETLGILSFTDDLDDLGLEKGSAEEDSSGSVQKIPPTTIRCVCADQRHGRYTIPISASENY